MLTTEEALAVAVLKGDLDAAQVLADLICEKSVGRIREIKNDHVKLIKGKHYKALVYLNDSDNLDMLSFDDLHIHVLAWVNGIDKVLVLPDYVDRVEIFEIVDR